VWLGTQTLKQTAPQERRRRAKEFIRFVGARSELEGVSIPPRDERWKNVRSGDPSSHPPTAAETVAAEIHGAYGFLERELAILNSPDFARNLRSSLKQLPLLCRLWQDWFEVQLAKRLDAEIRKMYPGSTILTKTQAGRQMLEALISNTPRTAIRKLLKEAGWNQAAWGKAAGVHHTTITHLVAGKPLHGESLSRLVDALEKKRKKVQLV
jgi:hypothetical protein